MCAQCILQNGILQNMWDHFGPFWTILAILDQVGQYGENGPKWSKMVKNSPKPSQMVPNGQKQFQAIVIGPKWSQCSSNSHKRTCASYPVIWCTVVGAVMEPRPGSGCCGRRVLPSPRLRPVSSNYGLQAAGIGKQTFPLGFTAHSYTRGKYIF